MTWPVATKNNMLDGQTFTHASVHDVFPGATGTGEIAGSTRQAITINAASGGVRQLSEAVSWTLPACTVRWIGLWNDAAFVGSAPNGGATPKNFMTLTDSDVVYCAAHGYAEGQKVAFFNGTPPGGVTQGTVYFVRDQTADTFKVSATLGGTAIVMTTPPYFGSVVGAITEQVYAAPSIHTLSTAQVVFPD